MADTAKSQYQIHEKIVVSFLLIGFGLVAGSYFILSLVMFPAFQAFEVEQGRDNLFRAEQAIQYQLQDLSTLNSDYARWDETYHAVQMPDSITDFVDLNVAPEGWPATDTDGMLIFDRQGALLWGRLLGPGRTVERPLEENLLSILTPGHPAVKFVQGGDEVLGTLRTPDGILLLASHTILMSDRSGQAMGRFATARYLSSERLEKIAHIARVDLNIVPVSGENVAPSVQESLLELEESSASFITEYSDGYIVSRSLLRDMQGKPLAFIETRTPRTISAIGFESVTKSLVFFSLAIIVAIFLAWFALSHWMVRPLSALKKHISAIRQTGDLSTQFNAHQQDEIGTLALEFDTLALELDGSQRDLTQALDKAKASSRAKSEFLANMSHEIRTPLNGVIGMTEILLNDNLSEKQQYVADAVKTSGQMLLKVINDILDFSKISAGKAQTENTVFSLRQLVNNINAVMAGTAQGKGLEYLVRLGSSLPGKVLADEQQITQVLVNLIGNAIKFTEEGEVTLSIECRDTKEESGGQWVTLLFRVADTGPGIPGGELENIFHSFSQADGSSTRKFGGTGLGLSISRGLAGVMGGEISVSSIYGKGAEFLFTLPVKTAGVSTALIPMVPGRLAGKRIMLVDDNTSVRDSLQSCMVNWQAHGFVACSGADALQQLEAAAAKNRHYDLLLVDYHMPEMDGIAFARKVCDENRYGKPKMVLLGLVADSLTEAELNCADIGSYLTKPVLEDELYLHLCQALNTGDKRDELASEKPFRLGQSSPYQDVDILVAEDDTVNQELILMQLRSLGARVELSENGEDAIRQLARSSVDLVIMDCQMPVMDGITATRRIREAGTTDKNGFPVPILAMTANVTQEARQGCLDAGMNAYISKPYSYNKLINMLQNLLPGSDQINCTAREA